MTHPLFTKHEDTLQKALTAVETRGYWSPFVEMPSPKVYGETANADGEAAFKAHSTRRSNWTSRRRAKQSALKSRRSDSRSACAIRRPILTH